MRIIEIEVLFQDEKTLDQVLVKLEKDFEEVDYVATVMKDNLTDNADECKKTLNKLTGTYINLKTVLGVAISEKRNREIRAYNQIKIDTENSGKKFVSASADKGASEQVAKYRRVRNIIEAYTSACEKAIGCLQSILKHCTEEMKLAGRNQ